jgi:hypothetical protein
MSEKAGSTWSDEEKRDLKSMWASGQSATKIAEVLGRSRSAVLGAVHRAGLWDTGRKAPETPRVRVRPVTREPEEEASPIVRALPHRPAVPDGLMSLVDLKHGRNCCFPVSGQGADTGYCGASTGGKVYCGRHHAVMFVARVNKATRA